VETSALQAVRGVGKGEHPIDVLLGEQADALKGQLKCQEYDQCVHTQHTMTELQRLKHLQQRMQRLRQQGEERKSDVNVEERLAETWPSAGNAKKKTGRRPKVRTGPFRPLVTVPSSQRMSSSERVW
jgi:hypothetical protein